MNLDIILPFALDYTPEGKFVPHLGNSADYEILDKMPDYTNNLECNLSLEFTPEGNINIDYIREDGTYMMAELFEFADEVITTADFVKTQYEIAALLGIKTLDL